MVHFSDCLRVDRVRVARQLVDFLVDIVLDFAHEVRSLDSSSADLLSDVEVTLDRILPFELAETNLLIRLRHGHVLSIELLVEAGAVGGQKLRVRLEELAEDRPAELDQDVLHLGHVSLALGLGQDPEADLHTLDVVLVSAHRCDLSFLGLVGFEEGADDQDRVNRHLLVAHAQVSLGLHSELGKGDR